MRDEEKARASGSGYTTYPSRRLKPRVLRTPNLTNEFCVRRTRSRRLPRRVRCVPGLLSALMLCLLLFNVGCWAQQAPLPAGTDRAGWVKRLSKITEVGGDDWNAVYRFRNLDPEFTYSVVQELWRGKISDALKSNLLQNFASDYGEFVNGPDGLPLSNPNINPHLLDFLDLGAADSSEDVRRTALNLSYSVAVHAFDTPDEYKAWRKATAGRSSAELARENSRSLFERFIKAAPDAQAKMLEQITRLSFSSGTYGTSRNGKEIHGILAHGLTGIRRSLALEMGLLDSVAGLLKEPTAPPAKDAPNREQTTRQVLYFLMSFSPDLPFMEKIEPNVQAVIAKAQAANPRPAYETIWFLETYNKSRWATDILLKMTAEYYPGDYSWMLTNALRSRDDPRVIPTLIAVLEDCGAGEDEVINNALIRITGAKPEADADADWWRVWRRKNMDKFPPEVAALPIPKLKSIAYNLVAIRRKKSLIEIDNDPRRAYWLISSGLILTAENKARTGLLPVVNGKTRYVISQPLPDKPSEAPVIAAEKKPGLLVVLTDSMENSEAQKTRWQEVAAQAFDGKYLIALARSPQTAPKQNPLWPLRPNQNLNEKNGPDRELNTENFVSEIVRDVTAKYPLRPDRIFLAGLGSGGSAAYACSLESQTPFHGFLLIDAPFRASQLPPLASAKNRRYYLLHHRQNSKTPFFIASAAQSALTKAGGLVQLTEYPPRPDKAPAPDADALAAALRWLQK